MRDVQISEDALEDLNNGYLFYEAQESGLGADSDESGHLFQSISDTIPILSDSCRSEATL